MARSGGTRRRGRPLSAPAPARRRTGHLRDRGPESPARVPVRLRIGGGEVLPLIPRLERGSTDGRRPRGTFGLPAFRLIPSFSSKGDPVVRFRSVLVVSAALAAAFACSPPPEEPAAPAAVAVADQPAGEYLRFEDVSGEAAWGRVEGEEVVVLHAAPWGGRSADRTAGSPRRSPPARTRRARQGDRHRAQLRLASRGPRARRPIPGFSPSCRRASRRPATPSK